MGSAGAPSITRSLARRWSGRSGSLTTLGERLVFLLAAALLAGLGTAYALHRHHRTEQAAAAGVSAPGGGWFDALAASRGPAGDAQRTTCGLVLTDRSLGVTEPVLP